MKPVSFVFPMEKGGGAYDISMVYGPRISATHGKFSCKTGSHRTIIPSVIASLRSAITFAQFLLFPRYHFHFSVADNFLLSLPSLCFSWISLSDSLIELTEE